MCTNQSRSERTFQSLFFRLDNRRSEPLQGGREGGGHKHHFHNRTWEMCIDRINN